MVYSVASVDMTPTPQQAARALHLVFLGGLLCLLDITHSSVTTFRGGASGWRFDFLSDTVGVVFILLGIRTLSRFDISNRFQSYLRFTWVVAWLSLIDTVHAHWIYDRPEMVRAMTALLSLIRLAAVMAFCTAMVDLAGFLGGNAAARSFRTTRSLFVVLYVAPLALLYSLQLAALAGAKVNFHWTGWWVTGILAVFALPLVHFFVSTRRLKTFFSQAQTPHFG